VHGLDNPEAAQQLMDAMRIHYNFIRPNQAIGGQTRAEQAGIRLRISENKVESLIRLAAGKQPRHLIRHPSVFIFPHDNNK